jgi:hypothetical protein
MPLSPAASQRDAARAEGKASCSPGEVGRAEGVCSSRSRVPALGDVGRQRRPSAVRLTQDIRTPQRLGHLAIGGCLSTRQRCDATPYEKSIESDESMRGRLSRTAPVWTGLMTGFLVFVVAYFLLPVLLANGVVTCGDVCVSPKSFSMWTLSLYQLSNFRLAPLGHALVLVALLLPLLGAVGGAGCSLVYHVRARHVFAVWSTGALVAGSVVLGLLLPLVLILGQPGWGYLGMLVGYGLLWAGSRRLLAAPPQQ